MKNVRKLAFVLLIVGGLNWLLVGLFKWDIGELFGGQAAVISRLVYILVGLAAVYKLFVRKGRGGGGEMDTSSGQPMV